jgi:hypothetical protein
MSRIKASSGSSGSGSNSSATSIANILVAGQTFGANTSYAVRWGIVANGENPDQVYAADYDASTLNNYWAIGIALSPTTVSPGGNINVYSFGTYTLGSSDTPFISSDIGNPVWLTSNGAFSTTAPSLDTEADEKIGIVMSTSQIWINDQLMGIGGGGGGGGGGGVTSLNGLTGAVDLVAGTSNITITEVGNNIDISFTGTGTGNVTGLPPTDIRAIARWADTTGTTIENSPNTLVQDSGAVEAQGFITMRDVIGAVTINADETWIAPSLELSLTGSIVIASGGDIIIV